jgi:hypothetical protein
MEDGRQKMNTSVPDSDIVRTKINLETSKIAWKELQRFFAGGKALLVSVDLDLVEVAFQMSVDNVEQIRQWTAAGQLWQVPDELAREWVGTDALVWAVVVSPWVLVQPVTS